MSARLRCRATRADRGLTETRNADHDECMTENIATDFRTIDGLPGTIIEARELVADDVAIVVMETAFVVGIARGEAIAKTKTGSERWWNIVVPSRWDEKLDRMIGLEKIDGCVVLRVDPREFGFLSHFMTPRALAFYAARRATVVIGEAIERTEEDDFAVRYSIGNFGGCVNHVTAERTDIERIIDADVHRAI